MRLQASVLGDGPPLCVLHGLFGRARNFSSLARHWSQHVRVIAMDLRNHGESPHGSSMSYETMANDVFETLAEHDALPAGMLGHSMGGKVAMLAALSRPALVSRLIVADIAPVAYRHHNAAVAHALQGLVLTPSLSRRAADAALAAHIPDPSVRGFLLQNLVFGDLPVWRIGLGEIASGMADIEGWPSLPSGTCYKGPALFVAGARSDYVRPTHWPVIRALFPGARQVCLDDAGHWLHADRPAEFAAVIDRFLEASAGNGA